MSKFFLVLLLIPLFSATSFAGEGFFGINESAPGFIKSSWDSVVLLVKKNRYIGSAFVIARKEKTGSIELYLITNNHVIDGACKLKTPCSEIKILQNPPQLPEKETVKISGDVRFKSLVIMKASLNPDLALIKVVLDKGETPSLLPLKISNSCSLQEGERTYLIGFPSTQSRTNEARRPIPDQELLLKRWSEGIFVKYLAPEQEINNASTGSAFTTNDALNGNSGGPMLNAEGELIGVVEAAAGRPIVGYPYTGRESADLMAWHSVAVSCERLKVFLGITSN